MNRVLTVALVLATLSLNAIAAETYTVGQKTGKTFKGFAQQFVVENCLDCHDNATKEGNLSLEHLGPVDETNADIWKSIWAQVTLREMPPDEESQLGVAERLLFSDWVVEELVRAMRDKGGFRAHLDPKKGNFVDHELLYGPLPETIRLTPTASPSRIWRLTKEEHMTRINDLINTEPAYMPEQPGLRTHGDAVPTNHGGELKLYFGIDRILRVQGNEAEYATAVTSAPTVLSSARLHGLENYPDLYSVNGVESIQTLALADKVIRYMAWGPLSIAKPEQITDDPKTYKMGPEMGGLPTSVVYSTKVVRPLTPVYELMKDPGVDDIRLRAAVNHLFEALTFRPPNASESDRYLELVKHSISKLGKKDGGVLGLSAVFVDRDALFRPEIAKDGKPDRHGRVMLQDWELGLAVNHALRYVKPDDTLRNAIVEGRMRTRADVKREVERMLADDSIRKPRVLQFFRDYFDHDLGGYICKDTKALRDAGVTTPFLARYYWAMFDSAASTDRLIELVLKEDRDVLKQLLTTQKVVTKPNNMHFGRRRGAEEIAALAATRKESLATLKTEREPTLQALSKEIATLEARLKAEPNDSKAKQLLDAKKNELKAIGREIKSESRKLDRGALLVDVPNLEGPRVFARVSRRSFGSYSLTSGRTLTTAPKGQRLGILTHPAWLVSHSDANGNHAIHRGIWVRERLLGGGIPDVPITVDAMLPDEPDNTLRERMRVTRQEYCWTCHKKMDPLGLPFEMYNHVGLFRTTELDKPVDSTGEIIDSGEPELDGKVTDAIELIQKIANSERAEQVFVRHAFRFWMGRNETLNDRPVLQNAHRAYRNGGGSMKALIISLLTSDAFLYRIPDGEPVENQVSGF